jgi:hypothetical protein
VRVTVYGNPLYRDGKLVSGKYSISINPDARLVIRTADGPVMRWKKKDADGRPVKDEGKVPLGAAGMLRVDGDEDLVVVPLQEVMA